MDGKEHVLCESSNLVFSLYHEIISGFSMNWQDFPNSQLEAEFLWIEIPNKPKHVLYDFLNIQFPVVNT